MNLLAFIFKAMRPYRSYVILSIFIMLYYALYISLRPYLIKLIINGAAMSNVSQGLTTLWTIVPLFALLQFSVSCAWRVHDWCLLQYEPALKNHIGKLCLDYVCYHDNRYFQNNMAGSLSTKISDLVKSIPSLILTMTNAYLTNFFCLLIASIFLWHIHIWFVLLMVGFMSFIIVVSIGTVGRSNQMAKQVSHESSKVMGNLVDVLTNMLNIRLFSAKDREMQRLQGIQQAYLKAAKNRLWMMLRFFSIQSFSFALYQVISTFALIHLYGQGQVTPGDFAMVFALNLGIVDNLWRMLGDMQVFTENWGAAEEAVRILMVPHEVEDAPAAKSLEVKQGDIQFNQVHFCYHGGPPLFQNKSIHIASGEKVGLVGYSGGGKSTFVSLILRLYDVSSGEILIDGQNIRQVSQDSLRQAIAMIPQDPSLFHRSVLENIRYGQPEASDEEVKEAAKKAYAHDFIMKLPQGYDSLVGERGVKLSGGQRQRIAIARAILKNAPILILDEATSQLDSVTEAEIQSSLLLLMENKTTIVIAHRLSTLLHMDRILVFDQGVIVEDGSHTELLKKKGLYKTLWEQQIGGFLPSAAAE